MKNWILQNSDSLGRIPIEFPEYTLKQVGDILNKRCLEAFTQKPLVLILSTK